MSHSNLLIQPVGSDAVPPRSVSVNVLDLPEIPSVGPSTVRLGVIGYGYWGPQIVRNFSNADGCQVALVCDQNSQALKRVKQAYPALEVTSDPAEILSSTSIDAVAVVTPVWTHFELAKAALENGKHVFVEKPFTSTAAQAEELIEQIGRAS